MKTSVCHLRLLATFVSPGLLIGAQVMADQIQTTSQNGADTSVNTTTVSQNPPNDANADSYSTTEIRRVRVAQPPDVVVQQPGIAAQPAPNSGGVIEQTQITEKHYTPSSFADEAVGIIPQVGGLSYTDPNGDSVSRGLVGLTLDFNLANRERTSPGRLFIGPSIGAFYANLGNPGGDFFGNTDGTTFTTAGNGPSATGLLLFPIDVKIGYTYEDVFRFSTHVGGNVLYYTKTNTNAFTTTASGGTANTGTFVNVGLDLEFGLGKSVALLLRPDWTLANTAMFSGTLGLTLPIT